MQDTLQKLNHTLVETRHKLNKNEQEHKDILFFDNDLSITQSVNNFIRERNIVPLTISDLIEKDWRLNVYSNKGIELLEYFGFDTGNCNVTKGNTLCLSVNEYLVSEKYKPNIVSMHVPLSHITMDDLDKEILQVEQNFFWINDLLVHDQHKTADTAKELFNDLYNARVKKYQLEILLNDTKDKLFKLDVEQTNTDFDISNHKPLTKQVLQSTEWYIKGYNEPSCDHLETMFKLAGKPSMYTPRCIVKHYAYSDTVKFVNPDNIPILGSEVIFKEGNLYRVDDTSITTSPTVPTETPLLENVDTSNSSNVLNKFLIKITKKLLNKLENKQ